MPTASWVGDSVPETDPAVAGHFLQWWHGSLPGGAETWTTITALPRGWANAGHVNEIIGGLNSGALDLDTLIWSGSGRGGGAGRGGGGGGGGQGLYHAVGVNKERPPQGRRGRDRDVLAVPGAWADLDVREGGGGFRDWDDIYNLVRELESAGIGPNAIVTTGSGGAHLYWRAAGGLTPEQGVHYSKRIRRWIQSERGIKIDNVAQPSRIMRLPGSLRFPKPGEGSGSGSGGVVVGLLTCHDTWTDFETLETVTAAAWSAVEERVQEQRERLVNDFLALEGVALAELEYQGVLPRADAVDLSGFYPGGGRGRGGAEAEAEEWDQLWGRYAFLEVFNTVVSWESILVPAGWTRWGEPDDEGRQSWTRPGAGKKNPRSAVTDWNGGPHVMSLLSDAPETGLSHLYEISDDATRRVFKLTKARVAAELRYDGSMEKLMGNWLAAHRRTGW